MTSAKTNEALIQVIDKIDPARFYGIPEVADMLGYSHTGISRWIERGKIQYSRIGYRRFLLGQDVINFLQGWK